MFDAYIQVFNKTDRLEKCLSSFRDFYPDSSIILFSDGGEDLTNVADSFSCRYFHSEVNTGLSSNGFSENEALEWLSRFKNSFILGKNPYILYLEDDVLIRGTISVPQESKILGAMENPIDDRVVDYFQEKYGFNFSSRKYGTCGGSIFHRETFLSIFENIERMIREDFVELETRFGYRLGFLDIFMPVLYMANGIEYDLNDQMVETHRNPQWMNTAHPIVHGKEW